MNTLSLTRHRLFAGLLKLSPAKRGVVVVVSLISTLVFWSQIAPASFYNAWLSKDQQAAIHFHNGQYKQASALFESPVWKAYSTYFSGNFSSSIEQLENIQHTDKKLAIANAHAHSGQFEKAQQLYQALYQDQTLSEKAKENYRLMAVAIEKVKNAPPEKSTNKSIDDRQIVGEESDKKAEEQVILSDQAWLNQVRQNPSNFLRQKFQSEYANEQN